MELNIVTIVAKNYLAQARVLTSSFKKYHPNGKVFVLVVDSIDNYFDPAQESFSYIDVLELREQIGNLEGFCFQYSILELSTAFKPYVIEYLLKKYNLANLAYFDPDILITASLQPIADLLNKHGIVLTPHLTQPYNDEKHPSEINILQAGTYNLGFIAVSNSETTFSMLKWWQDRLYKQCINDIANGLFVDQKWIDLVPGFFPKAFILHDPGYNAAYWNLHERVISFENDQISCNGLLLRFFHFSGFDPQLPQCISKHQNRHTIDSIGETRKLFLLYAHLLLENEYKKCQRWPYSYAKFDNHIAITNEIRRIYLNLTNQEKFGNPFETSSPNSFYHWLARGKSSLKRLIDPYKIGVNLSGYLNSEKGMGSAARSNINCIKYIGLPLQLNNVIDSGSTNKEKIDKHILTAENPYKINLIHVNADQLPCFAKEKGESYFQDKYNIGRWEWELSIFPEEWQGAFEHLDEVWVASSFIQEAISRVSPIPVVKVPHAIEVADIKEPLHNRQFFGIPGNFFVFLFVFDFHSFAARKNPFGTIEAFKKNFNLNDDAVLVIKSSHSEEHLHELKVLKDLAKNANVIFFDQVMSKAEVQSLMYHADCYVSLHRAEGFGLTLSEAMSLAKPVIATAYSGNTDFMAPGTCYPVNYKLVEIGQDYGPYKRNYEWAEPDLDHAASLMRYVYEHPEEAKAKGLAAREYILKCYSTEAVAKIYQQRLSCIADRINITDTTTGTKFVKVLIRFILKAFKHFIRKIRLKVSRMIYLINMAMR